ncbi:MAG: nuclease [Desulfobulbus sp.]|nr:nuclease [Desulfobulbus sp.]
MSTKQIHVFISHSWSYSGHYDTLSDWIFGRNWSAGQASLDLRDFSVPRNDPVHKANNDAQLKQALFDQISRSHVIVIPTGMYASYSKWIQKEIEGSQGYRKPILAVNPWGAQRTSSVVSSAAAKLVGWNADSVVGGIWELYKQ